MTVSVRTYQTLGDAEPGERFMARAIADVAVKKGGKPREGFSVFFYAETAEQAEAKANAWIAAERERVEAISANRQQAAKRRAT